MKSKRSKKIVNIILISVCLIIYVTLFVNTCLLYADILPLAILLCLLGLIITVYLTAFFHELGHLIFGFIEKQKLVSFKFMNFGWKRSSNGFTFFFDKFPENLGETVFIPQNENEAMKNLAVTVLGGLVFTLILFAIYSILACVEQNNNFIVFCLFGQNFAFPLYILLINLLPLKKDSDGALTLELISGGGNSKYLSDLYITGGLIYNGTEPKNLPPQYLSTVVTGFGDYTLLGRYYRYLSLLDVNEEKAFSELMKISESENYPDNLPDEIFAEIFFMALIKRDELFIQKHKDFILEYVAKADTPQKIRIHLAYRIYTGERDWAKLLYDSGLKLAELYVNKGEGLLEKSLIEKLGVFLK